MRKIRKMLRGSLSRNHRKCHGRSARLNRLAAAAAVCVSLLLAACGREGAGGGDSPSGGNHAGGGGQEQGWAYVPEVITVGDEHADYGRMQLVGDDFCYVSQEGDAEDSAKAICRYSLKSRELQRISLDFGEGGANWDAGAWCFDRNHELYLTANVYPADYSSMTRYLCKFDGEGNCLFSRDITEQLGRGSSLEGMSVDGQGRIYVFADGGEILLYTGDGEYRDAVSCSSSESPTSVQIRGACEGADGKYYVCVSKGDADVQRQNAENAEGGDARCSLMEIDFDGIRLSEVAGNLSDIKGFCVGAQRGGDAVVGNPAEPERNTAAQEGDAVGGNPAAQEGDAAGGNSNGSGEDAAGDTAGQKGATAAGEKDTAGQKEGAAMQGGTLAGTSGSSDRPYDFLLYDEKAVYGFELASAGSGTAGERLFAWMDSDINGYCVANLYLTEDGKLCATVEDWDNEDRAIVLLQRTDTDQAPQREELVLASVDGWSSLAAMAVKFNKGNSQYHLTVKSFDSLTDLYNAVLTGEPMDLVDLSGINGKNLAAQGVLENLAPYVEKSEAFVRSDFVDGILDAYTFDEKLIGIPASFTLRTVVGNGAQGEEQAGLTLEGLLAAAERHPGAQAFDGITRDEMMQYLMMFNEDTFIDWDTGDCRFDSETFRAVLGFVKQFPDSVRNPDSPGNQDFSESNPEETSLPVKIRNGEVLFAVAELNTLRAFQEYEGMFGETAVCVGFPTPEGRGGHLLFTGDAYGMMSQSRHKEGAWKFIEGFLAQEKSDSYYGNFLDTSFPTLKKTLNEKVEEAIAADSLYESDVFPELIYSDGTTFQYHALTWEDVNAILNLIPDAQPYFDAEGDEVIRIICEEAAGYYSGQKSAEEVAGVIQNRVRLYVNENRK